MILKATKGKYQNRISLKQQRFSKTDKNESFRFLSSLQMCLFEDYAMKIVEITIGYF